ncbi:MAG: hypothetical protein KA436_05885 [Oligoflexales bacterium]|nr:hypothetical protein [Oligoflexales bacterium]
MFSFEKKQASSTLRGIRRWGLALVSVGLVSSTSFAEAPRVISADPYVNDIFIPNGFDDNDNIEFVLAGFLPDTCYRAGQARYSLDEARKVISIEATAFDYTHSDRVCLQVLTPFMFKVGVGLLEIGDYAVTLKSSDGSSQRVETLHVAKSTSRAPDDFLYAPVVNASAKQLGSEKIKIDLEGTYPSMFRGCMVMKEVKTITDQSGIVVVQPIAEVVDDNRCLDQQKDFKVSTETAFKIEGSTLLHVRVSNGLSVNRVLGSAIEIQRPNR